MFLGPKFTSTSQSARKRKQMFSPLWKWNNDRQPIYGSIIINMVAVIAMGSYAISNLVVCAADRTLLA